MVRWEMETRESLEAHGQTGPVYSVQTTKRDTVLGKVEGKTDAQSCSLTFIHVHTHCVHIHIEQSSCL